MKKTKTKIKKSLYNLKQDILRIIPKLNRKPLFITLDVTKKCNSKCVTCYCWKIQNEENLPKKIIFKFIDEISNWLGKKEIILSGGEPLLRKDIFEILDRIHKKGCYAKLITNGLLLTPKVIDELAKSNLSCLSISLNAIDPKIHDFSRGSPGNLKKIFKSVSYIKKIHPNLPIDFTMIIYNENINQILPVIKYVNSVNASVNFQILAPIFFAEDSNSNLLPPDVNKLSEIFEQIKKYKKQGFLISVNPSYLKNCIAYLTKQNSNTNPDIKKCDIGLDFLMLKNNGNMHICPHYPSIGNIKNKSIKELWKNDLRKKQRKQMLKCRKNCTPLLCTFRPTFKETIKKLNLILKRRLSRKCAYRKFQ